MATVPALNALENSGAGGCTLIDKYSEAYPDAFPAPISKPIGVEVTSEGTPVIVPFSGSNLIQLGSIFPGAAMRSKGLGVSPAFVLNPSAVIV